MAQVNEGDSRRTSPDVAAGQRVAKGQCLIKVVAPEIVRGQYGSQAEPPPSVPELLAPPVAPPPAKAPAQAEQPPPTAPGGST